jgi:hypothetical protein
MMFVGLSGRESGLQKGKWENAFIALEERGDNDDEIACISTSERTSVYF